MTAGSVGAALAETRRALAAAGIATAALEARLFVARAAGLSETALLSRGGDPVSAAARAVLDEWVMRRLAREPVAYLFGEKEFWSLPFVVDGSTLIPRPEFETLIEGAFAFIGDVGRPLRVLDFGTGCGCLLLTLLHAVPAATGVGTDRSEAAVRIALRNAERLGLAARAAFVCGDWADAIAGPFDIIVANPPYVGEAEWPTLPPEIRVFEPRSALIGGVDGLAAYRELLPAAARLLAPGGAAFFEIGCGQAPAVTALAARAGFQRVDVTRDLAGIERCIQALTAAR